MTRPRVTTVLSARDWETALVADARNRSVVRIVGRVYRPDEIRLAATDVVVVGDETPWLDRPVVAWWGAHGVGAVVVTDRPLEVRALEHVRRSSSAVESILASVQDLWLIPPSSSSPGAVTAVVGPAGSGITEVACGVALLDAPTTLFDSHPPAVRLRLGLPPDQNTVGGISVEDRHPEPGEQGVLDAGRKPPQDAHRTLLVVRDGPGSYLDGARIVDDWSGPIPQLVVNMVHDRRRALRAARASIGLEPSLLLPFDPDVHNAAAQGHPPPPWLGRELRDLIGPAGAPHPP